MAAKNATNGYLRLANTDTFNSPAPGNMFLPRGVAWAGGQAAGSKAFIRDADGITVCYMTIGAAGDMAILDGHFYGEARPWKTPITATMSGGIFLIAV
jgi:hypothetical protein